MLVVGPQKGEFQSKGVNKQRERKNILDKWGKSIKDQTDNSELQRTTDYGILRTSKLLIINYH